MNVDETITLWIKHLKAGDELAAQRLWERYYHRLVGLAVKRLAGARQRLATEEDVALSAFKSLCLGAEQGRFPALTDRANLWPLLVVITSRKASRQLRHERRQKRGSGRTLSEADLPEDDVQLVDQVLGAEPTPALAAEMAEECERLLQLLDADARAIALAKLEGFTNPEIAARQGLALRSVERKLQLVRRIWEDAAQSE